MILRLLVLPQNYTNILRYIIRDLNTNPKPLREENDKKVTPPSIIRRPGSMTISTP